MEGTEYPLISPGKAFSAEALNGERRTAAIKRARHFFMADPFLWPDNTLIRALSHSRQLG